MALTDASIGALTKLGVIEEVTYGTALTATRQLNFVSEGIAKKGVIVEREALRGFFAHPAEDTRIGPYSVGGPLVLEPTPEDLAVILPWIMGADASGTTFALADTDQSFTATIDRIAKVFCYPGCVVDSATFSGATGGMMRVALDIIAKGEGGMTATVYTEGGTTGGGAAAGTFPSLTPSITAPFMFNDAVFTLGGAVRQASSFEITLNWNRIRDRFMNSTRIISAPKTDQLISVNVVLPYNVGTTTAGNEDLYAQALAGAAGSIVLTNAGYALTFTFATLQVPDNTPTIQGRGEIALNLNMMAKKSGSTAPLVITLDSTN